MSMMFVLRLWCWLLAVWLCPLVHIGQCSDATCDYSQRGSDEKRAETVGNSTLVLIALIPISTEPEGPQEKDSFLYAVHDVNADDSVLVDRHVVPVIYDTAGDTWIGFQSAIDGISRGAVAVVGPGLSTVASFLSPLATYTQVPFVTPSAKALALALRNVHEFVLQSAPSDRLLSQAIVDLLVKYEWQHVGIVSSSNGPRSVWNVDVLASREEIKIIHIADIPPLVPDDDSPATIGKVVGLMKQLKYNNARIMVVNVPDHSLSVVFRAAATLGMIGADYLWIVSGIESPVSVLDPELVDLMEGSLGLSTALPERAREWQVMHNITSTIGVYQLYTYDCVWLLARAIDNFLRDGHSLQTEVLSESKRGLPSLRRLTDGHSLVDYILNTSFEGVSGKIQFNNQTGERFRSLRIINVVNRTFQLVGQWNSHGDSIDKRINMGEEYPQIIWPDGTTNAPSDRILSLNQTIDVLVMVSEPYVFYHPNQEGNDRFTGYLVSVLERIKQGVGFSYQLKKWNGTYNDLVKYISDVNNSYTMAVADTIPTRDRWKIVDFTATFHFSSTTVLFSSPRAADSGWLGFLAPFSLGVWSVFCVLLCCRYYRTDNFRMVQLSCHVERMSVDQHLNLFLLVLSPSISACSRIIIIEMFFVCDS